LISGPDAIRLLRHTEDVQDSPVPRRRSGE
jgi:hypothetical protein